MTCLRRSGRSIFRFFLKTAIASLVLFQSITAEAGEFVVIVNRNGPIAAADMKLIKEIYLGEKTIVDNVKLLPVNFMESPLRDGFFKQALGMTAKDFKRHWLFKVFQEGLQMPQTFDSMALIVKFVRENKGAIGYVSVQYAAYIDDSEDIVAIRP